MDRYTEDKQAICDALHAGKVVGVEFETYKASYFDYTYRKLNRVTENDVEKALVIRFEDGSSLRIEASKLDKNWDLEDSACLSIELTEREGGEDDGR